MRRLLGPDFGLVVGLVFLLPQGHPHVLFTGGRQIRREVDLEIDYQLAAMSRILQQRQTLAQKRLLVLGPAMTSFLLNCSYVYLSLGNHLRDLLVSSSPPGSFALGANHSLLFVFFPFFFFFFFYFRLLIQLLAWHSTSKAYVII
jgi:hypothetical protein